MASSTKVLFTADWQARLGNLAECEVVLQRILELVRSEKLAAVVHLGDLKHSFNPLDIRVTNFLVAATQAIVAKCPFYVLLGNHDRAGPSDRAVSFFPAMEAAGAKVTADAAAVQHLGGEGLDLVMVPYFRDLKAQREAFIAASELPKSASAKTRVLCFHAEVAGSCLTVSHKANATSAVKLADLRPEVYQACVGGHVHFQQQLIGSKVRPRVWYVGSPFPQDWGEVNQSNKGFILLEVDRANSILMRSIPSGCKAWYDPAMPGFTAPSSWSGCKVRVRASKPGGEAMAQVLDKARKRYPGANICVLPFASQDAGSAAPSVDLAASDRTLVRRYLASQATKVSDRLQMTEYLMDRLIGGGIGISDLRFVSVTGHDVLSFRDVKLDLTVPGITLVTGVNEDWGGGRSNGAGKTNLLALPALALFGSSLKGQTGDHWCRRGSEGSSEVKLRLRLPDGRKADIDRRRNPAALSVQVDGKDCSMGDVRGTQRFIETLTGGLTWDVAAQAYYLGQHEVTTILTGTEKERKVLFGRFLGLDRYLRAEEAVRADWRRCLVVSDDVASDQTLVTTLLESETAGSQQVSAVRVVKKQTLAKAKALVEKLRSQKEHIVSKQQKLVDMLTKLRKRESEVESERLFQSKVSVDLTAWVAKIEGLAGRLCPVCGSQMSAKVSKKRITDLRVDLLAVSAAIIALKKKGGAVGRLISTAVNDASVLSSKLERLNELLDNGISSLAELRAARQAWLQAKAEADAKTQRVAQLRRRLAALGSYQQWLMLQKDFYERAGKVVGRDGLPTFLCASTCPSLNVAADEFAALFGGAIRVQFVLEDGDIDVRVLNEYGGEELEDQSQGEMRLAVLAAALAFRAVLARSNLLVLDEPGEGLDAQNAADFARGLTAMVPRFGSIFISTHSPFVLAELDPVRHLVVTKQDRISTVAEEAL